jgi:hypothetical protein
MFGHLLRSGAPGNCHPEAAESLAKPRTPNEGSVHSGDSAAMANCIDPSAHKGRGPQDDRVGEALAVTPMRASSVLLRKFRPR